MDTKGPPEEEVPFQTHTFPVLCLFLPGGMDANRMNLGICWILSGDLHLGVAPILRVHHIF